MTYFKSGTTIIEARIEGKKQDAEWDNRESKTIYSHDIDPQVALQFFTDNMEWSIIDQQQVVSYVIDEATGEEVLDESGNPITKTQIQNVEYDNSDFNMLGSITIHRDGSIAVVMGKPTELEEAYEMLYGGI